MRPFVLLILWILASGAFAHASWEKTLREAVAQRLPAKARIEVQILSVSLDAVGKLEVVDFTPDQGMGYVSFAAQATQGGRRLRGQGTATVKVFAPIAVANQALSHGDTLNERTVRFEERELGRYTQSGYFLSFEALGDRRAKGFVASAQVLGRNNTQSPPLVVQGQSVELIRRSGSLVLSAKVRALQAGGLDQWIQVQNPSSGKLFVARVSAPGEVEVR